MSLALARLVLFLAEDGPGGGVGRGPAEVVGERATRVGHDPHVQHLFGVPVRPGRRVAGAPLHLEADSAVGSPAAPGGCECQRVSDPPTCGPFVFLSSMYMAPSRMGA